jgi:hypothetical protein
MSFLFVLLFTARQAPFSYPGVPLTTLEVPRATSVSLSRFSISGATYAFFS